MADEEDDQPLPTEPDHKEEGSTSSSEDEDSDDEEASPVEWLATSREKRSTAGNRMKSMLAAEEPDDELELLFAEDGEEDGGFTEAEEDASDVQMDSSSDDEDAQENGDEDEGEKELRQQVHESRQAARKRKAQEAIPLKFRKKVKIHAGPYAGAPKPRPKKKSERTSWLPSPADMPTRASKRETTMLSKESLHQQMIEREIKRLKQVEAMERKAKRLAALKKPPMTQAQRLAEAVIVERRNAKSLNRWEEAEKQREEERLAKLAALNNRQLSGPVVTFWSGQGEWIDGKLRHLGKTVVIEDKPAKKKRASAIGVEEPSEAKGKEKGLREKDAKDPPETLSQIIESRGDEKQPGQPTEPAEKKSALISTSKEKPNPEDTQDVEMTDPKPPSPPPRTDAISTELEKPAGGTQQEPRLPQADHPEADHPETKLPETKPPNTLSTSHLPSYIDHAR
jgi:vacuolar protein sorting-associated protein 72